LREGGSTLNFFWQRHRGWLLPGLVILLGSAATLKLAMEFYRLLWEPTHKGAVDLKHLQDYTVDWFSGRSWPLFYPPSAYLLLWPLVGWMSFAAARWFWAFTSILALAASIFLMLRIADPKTSWERWFVALLLLSLNGTGVTIGNGQLILHLLPAILASVFVLERGRGTFLEDTLSAALMTWALMKPSVSAPFFWMFLFAWKRWRPALLIVVIFAAVTLSACAFRTENLVDLCKNFVTSSSWAVDSYVVGTRNIHGLFDILGWQRWNSLASISLLLLLGVWTFLHRRADPWVLVGVAALVARVWAYHRVYDDVLIVLAELALFRIATRSASADERTVAGALLGLTTLAMLCPATLLQDPAWWTWGPAIGHMILWGLVAACLMFNARQEREFT
jgi:hypothetical protein